MLSIEEQKLIIEKFIKSNKSYSGNEDLFEDFCSEALQKSYMAFRTFNNEQKIESYVSKVVHTSIIKVLKDYGRVRREHNHYTAVKEIKTADLANTPAPGQLKEESSEEYTDEFPLEHQESEAEYQGIESSSFILELPDPGESAEEILITKDCLQRIADTVCTIHKEVPSQLFLNLFYLRYIKGLKQSDIGRELGLSQSEVSKRLMRLSKLISNMMDERKR